MTVTRDETEPGDRWAFDAAVTDAFDDMLARSIPQYEVMRAAVLDVGSRFVRRGSTVVDLGCSRGEALAGFVDRFGAGARYLGVEVSDPMRDAATARFAEQPELGVSVSITGQDLRDGYPSVTADLTLLVLTLQFIPIEHRQRIIRDAWRATAPGGALILVEKVLGSTADVNQAMVDLYYEHKRASGYSQAAIDRKRLSLEGVLVPVTARWNEELLTAAGFTQLDCFWRWMNFAAWVAIRD